MRLAWVAVAVAMLVACGGEPPPAPKEPEGPQIVKEGPPRKGSKTAEDLVKEVPGADLPKRMVVAFRTAEAEVKDDWTFFLEDLKTACVTRGVDIRELEPGVSTVKFDEADEADEAIDLTAAMGSHDKGYVAIQEGKKPEYVPFRPPPATLKTLDVVFVRGCRPEEPPKPPPAPTPPPK